MYSTQLTESKVSLNKKDVYARALLLKLLANLKDAVLTLVDYQGETIQMGDNKSSLHAEIIVKNPAVYQRIISQGSIGAAEAYVDGWWDSPNLTDLVRVLCRNMAALDEIESKTAWLTYLTNKLRHWGRRNNLSNSQDNISAHYDLGNGLYRQFLDQDMLYSSGIFIHPDETLELAQKNKMARLCQQLDLNADDHVLEIGAGWGAMAIYMAKKYGCRVTTTTISDEQYQWTRTRIEQAGLGHQIQLLKTDYRVLTGQYDKIVSIEMIEAVGKRYLKTFVNQCQNLLKPNGLLALQMISIVDQRFEYYSQNVDFIQKHIFPGGFLPSISALLDQMTQSTDFVLRDLKDIGLDYAKTLQHWHQRFERNQKSLLALGYDDQFIRLWRYYFCYCEGGFLERSISTVQLLFSRPEWR